MEMDLIYRRAHYFHRMTGQSFEDLVQEGVVGSLEAELTYDPDKDTKLTTWVWWSIERRMRVFCERAMRHRGCFGDPPDLPDYRNIVEFLDFLNASPRDAQTIYEIVLSNPEEYAGHSPYECQRMLKQVMLQLGWSTDRSHDAIQDAKYWLNNISADMTRTK